MLTLRPRPGFSGQFQNLRTTEEDRAWIALSDALGGGSTATNTDSQ